MSRVAVERFLALLSLLGSLSLALPVKRNRLFVLMMAAAHGCRQSKHSYWIHVFARQSVSRAACFAFESLWSLQDARPAHSHTDNLLFQPRISKFGH